MLERIRRSTPWERAEAPSRFSPQDLDEKLLAELRVPAAQLAPPVDDATFLRRVSLDLLGRPPTIDEAQEFIAATDPRKRERRIETLLSTPEWSRRWAGFWREVLFVNVDDNNRYDPAVFDTWLAETLHAPSSTWDHVATELLTASGKDKKTGPDNFLLAFDNKPAELAAETARVFMGINIQCAECHDHPFDRWKREQFHAMAAFFARGPYEMPGRYDPEEKTVVPARFLLGEKPSPDLTADQRRVAMAAYLVYNPNNYWFARAHVNRIWNELLGDGFYAVDSLGPDGEVVHKMVVNKLAHAFRGERFDVRWPFRVVMNSAAYQRQMRTPQGTADLFTAVRPCRLRADQVAAALSQVVGREEALMKKAKSVFAVNPSIPQADLEGAIQQALFLMNDEALQKGIQEGPLARRLMGAKSTSQLVEQLYLGCYARYPQEEERRRAEEHLAAAANRAEGVHDLIWALVNSAEFITKR